MFEKNLLFHNRINLGLNITHTNVCALQTGCRSVICGDSQPVHHERRVLYNTSFWRIAVNSTPFCSSSLSNNSISWSIIMSRDDKLIKLHWHSASVFWNNYQNVHNSVFLIMNIHYFSFMKIIVWWNPSISPKNCLHFLSSVPSTYHLFVLKKI